MPDRSGNDLFLPSLGFGGDPDDNLPELPGDFCTVSDSVPSLFHYTSADGILGIISSGTIRAANFNFLNDAYECLYGHDLTKEALQRLLNVADIDKAFRKTVEIALDIFDDQSAGLDAYVACFCARADLLSQWRGYGSASSRYCLELDGKSLREQLTFPYPFFLHKVVYDPETQYRRIGQVIDHVRDLESYGATMLEDAVRLVNRLIELSPLLKHPSFAEESEWRAVVFHGGCANGFVSSSGILKPFVDLIDAKRLRLLGQRLPLRRVIVGPMAQAVQARRAVRMLLDSFNYPEVEVDGSAIPLRG